MQSKTIEGTTITVSELGLGTSNMMGRLGKGESLKLLGTALDAGINYFDTARMYGYGEAEKVLGIFARGKRLNITITTKAGILPPSTSPGLRAAKVVARQVQKVFPSIRRLANKHAHTMIKSGSFDIATIRTSLETSLRQLQTDYVDIFLLHDCDTHDLANEDLLNFVRQTKAAGKIKYFGVASSLNVAMEALKTKSEFGNIIQIGSSIRNPNVKRLAGPPGFGVITHSALRDSIELVNQAFAGKPDLSKLWAERLDIPSLSHDAIGAITLKCASQMNRRGPTLFSTNAPKKILANTSIAGMGQLAETEICDLIRVASARVETKTA